MTSEWDRMTSLGAQTWLAIAVWTAVAVGIAIAVVTHRQMSKNRQLRADRVRPEVAMYMEPHPSDWHVIELVVRNYGQTAAHDVRFEFAHPPTVAVYEDNPYDGPPEVVELELPSELPHLAPGQEWRTVWDSAISREELGGSIRSRFDGTVRYTDTPRPADGRNTRAWKRRRSFESKVSLDWGALQPVQRLELLTTHDLAKREKQKLELLRTVLTYFHYASKETQPEVFRQEIERMKGAVAETQDRWRTRQLDQTTELDLPWLRDDPAGRHRVGTR